jgi:hypothetical protein
MVERFVFCLRWRIIELLYFYAMTGVSKRTLFLQRAGGAESRCNESAEWVPERNAEQAILAARFSHGPAEASQ